MNRAHYLRNLRRARKAKGTRRRVQGTPERPRLTVHRSSKEIYVQAVDDLNGVTLAASSSRGKELRDTLEGSKAETARQVGEDIAKRLVEKGVQAVVFDRGWYRYHGRVRALADGARAGGLKF
ncbi:MAG: 50S ribosomal protein L18 [Planctomycetota bacterium]|jgi:large subunit ribosomal protein L18